MIKRILHGSKDIIKTPIFGHGKKYNDYGLGFYCTESVELAKEWAVDIDRDGYANSYDLDMTDLSVLDLNNPEYSVLNWLSILLQNRTFEVSSGLAREAKRYLTEYFTPNYETMDIIIGYRADDSYFSFAQDFINNTISYRQLSEAMRLGKLGQQICLKSKKAFSQISFVDAEKATSEDWFVKKNLRDKKARKAYYDLHKNSYQRGELYMITILDEEIKNDDIRLRQNIS